MCLGSIAVEPAAIIMGVGIIIMAGLDIVMVVHGTPVFALSLTEAVPLGWPPADVVC